MNWAMYPALFILALVVVGAYPKLLLWAVAGFAAMVALRLW